jgi:DNA uptake protein ComE-like DNA-binding protein
MATQAALARRREVVLQRLADALNVTPVRHRNADVQSVMQLEAIADAAEAQGQRSWHNDLQSAVESASVKDLAELPGVGEVTAKRIKKAAKDN